MRFSSKEFNYWLLSIIGYKTRHETKSKLGSTASLISGWMMHELVATDSFNSNWEMNKWLQST